MKNFFELLIKTNWRKWVEAAKKELEGWESNGAVTVVSIKDVPANAKVVPLGELYTRKRDGRYKFRQYVMANLLREGVDFADTFSTVSGSGICTFFSLATTCKQEVWGWDAVCGYGWVAYKYPKQCTSSSSLGFALIRTRFFVLVLCKIVHTNTK